MSIAIVYGAALLDTQMCASSDTIEHTIACSNSNFLQGQHRAVCAVVAGRPGNAFAWGCWYAHKYICCHSTTAQVYEFQVSVVGRRLIRVTGRQKSNCNAMHAR